MKRRVCLGVMIAAANALAATWHVAPDGDNAAAGTAGEPWREMAYAARRAAPGDTVVFRGGIYRGAIAWGADGRSGEPGRPITLRSAPGEKPEFYGSVSFASEADWTSEDGLIWRTAPGSVPSYDVGCVWMDDRATEKKWSREELADTGDFYFDPQQQCVFLRAADNPARLARRIEIPVSRQWQHLLNLGGLSHIVLDGLTIKYTNTHGIQLGGSHYVTVRNCTISHGGGAWIWEDRTRYGNAVEVYGSGHDILVENCDISWFFDTGITNQGQEGEQANIVFRGNRISHVKCALEHWATGSLDVRHVLYEGNHITDTGANWAGNLQNVWGAVRLMRVHPNEGHHQPPTGVVEDFRVRGNRIERCGSQQGGQRQREVFREHPSIRVIGGPYIIEDNTITDGLSDGIYVSHGFSGRITGNTVRNCAWSGLIAEDLSPEAEIRDNVIENNGDAGHPNVVLPASG